MSFYSSNDFRYIKIHEEIVMSYLDSDPGDGDSALLFIHGLGGNTSVWWEQWNYFSKSTRCIVLDLPGNGFSSRGKYPYTIFFYAECVARFMEKMGINNVFLCGHSMGGQISIVLALRYPHLIQKLILIAPAGFEYFYPHEQLMLKHVVGMGSYFYPDELHMEEAIRGSFYKKHPVSEQLITAVKETMNKFPLADWRDMIAGSVHGMLNEQVNGYLEMLQQPVLVIYGEEDRFIPNRLLHPGITTYDVGRDAISRIPQAELHMVPDAGHFVQFEKANEVNDTIRLFMQK